MLEVLSVNISSKKMSEVLAFFYSSTQFHNPAAGDFKHKMELITIQANALLVCTNKSTQADVHCRPWEYEPGNRTQVHLLPALRERSAKFRERDATFQLCCDLAGTKAETVRKTIAHLRLDFVR